MLGDARATCAVAFFTGYSWPGDSPGVLPRRLDTARRSVYCGNTMNAATSASTVLPYIVTREPHTSGRWVVWNQRGKKCLQLATVQEVVDFIIDEDQDVIRDGEGNVLDWDEEASRVVRLYDLQPDPEVGRAAMGAFWSEVLEQTAQA